MKKLTKSKRATVRFLLNRAITDLTTAKTMTFKAYGSHRVTDYLRGAIEVAGFALADLHATKIPQKVEKEVVAKECFQQATKTAVGEVKTPSAGETDA